MRDEAKYQQIIEEIYQDIPGEVIDIVADPDVSDFETILHLICRLASMVELFRIDHSKLKGTEKKYIVTKLGRFLIEQHCEERYKDSILSVYDDIFEKGLLMVIEFAKNNKVLRRAKTACC